MTARSGSPSWVSNRPPRRRGSTCSVRSEVRTNDLHATEQRTTISTKRHRPGHRWCIGVDAADLPAAREHGALCGPLRCSTSRRWGEGAGDATVRNDVGETGRAPRAYCVSPSARSAGGLPRHPRNPPWPSPTPAPPRLPAADASAPTPAPPARPGLARVPGRTAPRLPTEPSIHPRRAPFPESPGVGPVA